MPENRRPRQTTDHPSTVRKTAEHTTEHGGTDSKTAEQHSMCIFRVNIRQISTASRLHPNYIQTYILMYLTSNTVVYKKFNETSIAKKQHCRNMKQNYQRSAWAQPTTTSAYLLTEWLILCPPAAQCHVQYKHPVKLPTHWINSSEQNAAANFSAYCGRYKHSPIAVIRHQTKLTNSLTHC